MPRARALRFAFLERAFARRDGFTLIELMVVLAIAAVLATMVLPMMRNDERINVIAMASLVRSDIEFAQSISISQPNNPAVVKFNADDASYFVAYASDPDTPITRADNGEVYEVRFGYGRAVAGDGVSISITGADDDAIAFDSHGGLVDFTQTPVITITAGQEWFTLTISPATGSITEASGTGNPPDTK